MEIHSKSYDHNSMRAYDAILENNTYCSGYNTGALFLDSINRNDPAFIHDLGAYIVAQDPNPWAGSDAMFQAVIGKSLDDAYATYLAEYELELEKPVAECDYPGDIP